MEIVYVVLFVCYTSYSYNRKSVSFVSPKLIEEGLDTSYAGLILTTQNAAFALSKFVAGLLSDRTNPKFLFTIGILLSGLSTVLFASSSSVGAFCALWFLNGLAQGCGWPSCAKILREKASPARFGTLWSILSSSNNVSGSLSPFVSAYICYNYGWRTSVLVAGVTTLLLIPVCLHGLDSSPKKDLNSKKDDSPKSKDDDTESETFSDLLSDPFLLIVSFGFMVALCTKSTFADWGPLYLIEERHRSPLDGSAFVSSVETGGFVGRIAAGYLSDYFVKRNLTTSGTDSRRSKSNSRMFVALFFVLGTFVLTHALRATVTATTSMVWLTTLGFTLGACVYGPIAIYGIVASESAPPHLSGSSNAIAALAGNIGAMISGFPFCYIAKHHSWEYVILLLQMATGVTLGLVFYSKTLQPKATEAKKEV